MSANSKYNKFNSELLDVCNKIVVLSKQDEFIISDRYVTFYNIPIKFLDTYCESNNILHKKGKLYLSNNTFTTHSSDIIRYFDRSRNNSYFNTLLLDGGVIPMNNFGNIDKKELLKILVNAHHYICEILLVLKNIVYDYEKELHRS